MAGCVYFALQQFCRRMTPACRVGDVTEGGGRACGGRAVAQRAAL